MRNKIITFLLFVIFLFNFSTAFAQPGASSQNECDNDIIATPNEAICNPSPDFYIDFERNPDAGVQNTFRDLLKLIVKQVLGLVGIIAVAFIILGGFQYITSAGNEEQAESGKKTLTNAIIGLAIVILSYMIVVVIFNALGKLG